MAQLVSSQTFQLQSPTHWAATSLTALMFPGMIEWLNDWMLNADWLGLGNWAPQALKTGSFRSEQILAKPQQPNSLYVEKRSQNLQGVLVGTFICLMYCLNYLCKCWSDWNVNGLTAKCCNDSYTWLWNVCNEMTNETKCCSPFDVAS